MSVGEVRSAAPLVAAIQARCPRQRIVVTTMTPTGADQVAALFGSRVEHAYAPYDFPDAVARFIDRVRPELAIIAETEFWPNLFAELGRRSIPLHLVNVRMSKASFRGYGFVGDTVRDMFSHAVLICAQTPIDAQRLRNLGVDPEKIEVAGNLKFDVPVPEALIAAGRTLRTAWGEDRPVLIAASTHSGEDAQVLDAFTVLRKRFPTLLLVLVPRHPERFSAVVRQVGHAGFNVARRSEYRHRLPGHTDVLVGDTMGELHKLYGACDVAFVGGSLVRHGGQNLLEAFSVAVPVVFGPHMFHFEEISAMALDRGAAFQVRDSGELADRVAGLLEQPSLRRAAARAGAAMLTENRGALGRTLELMAGRSPAALTNNSSDHEAVIFRAP